MSLSAEEILNGRKQWPSLKVTKIRIGTTRSGSRVKRGMGALDILIKFSSSSLIRIAKRSIGIPVYLFISDVTGTIHFSRGL